MVGGAPGGATCAKYQHQFDPSVGVTLVEKHPVYYTCFGANWNLGGLRTLGQTRQGFDVLQKDHGVKMIQDTVTEWDTDKGELEDAEIRGVEGAGGVSPSDAGNFFRMREARYARGWFDGITDDIWG